MSARAARQLLKRIKDADLVVPDFVSVHAPLKRYSSVERLDIRLAGDPLNQSQQAVLFECFRNNRINIDWSERNAALGVEGDRHDVVPTAPSKHARLFNRGPSQSPLPELPRIRRDPIITPVAAP